MFIVMGATGNIGAAVADELLGCGEAVTILTRRPEQAGAWADKGASVAHADADDVASLKAAFRRGTRAFLLNPPADPSGNTDAAERRTIANILAALAGSGLEKVVAASTYGAQPGEAIGDLSTLWQLEDGLRAQSIPAAIDRGAYYMTNWLGFTRTVRETGVLPSMFPPTPRCRWWPLRTRVAWPPSGCWRRGTILTSCMWRVPLATRPVTSRTHLHRRQAAR